MATRGHDVATVAEQFRTFADAEGSRIPVYAAISRAIAADAELHGLLLEAPLAQRLPVLLLAALHDVVLRHPAVPVAPWYPSVSDGPVPPTDGLHEALRATVDSHRAELVELLGTRQVQTNEVNRCTAWRLGLHHLSRHDASRPLALVELGASAGLNLALDRYGYRIESPGAPVVHAGREDSDVQLGTTVRTGAWPGLEEPLPPVVARVGLDQRPLDPTDPADARWLRACVWPEQRERFERLDAALAAASRRPPEVLAGDLVDDLPAAVARVVEASPSPPHVVALASWTLVYVSSARRALLRDRMAELGTVLHGRGAALSLLTLEADHVLPWMDPPPLPPDAGADERHASILAATRFDPQVPDGAAAVPLARCQAHLAWVDLL